MSTGAASTPTVRSLDVRIDQVELEHKVFRTRVELVISLLKWLGGLVVVTLVTVVIQLLTISFSAGKLHQKVDENVATMQGLRKDMGQMKSELRSDMQDLRSALQDLRREIGKKPAE